MKREIAFITFLDILFLLLLSFSGSTSGVFSEILYYIAFILPIALGLRFVKITASAESSECSALGIKMTKSDSLKFIPLVFPVITAVFAVSLLTSVVMGLFGFADSTVINEPFPLAVLLHALIPAILEEMLFRYIPLKLTLRHSGKWAVILSSLFFSLVHADLFRIPYAFIAGILFALVDISAGSILPSIILHFLNNTLSLVFMMYFGESGGIWFFLALIALSAISSVIIIIYKKSYKNFLSPLTSAEKAVEISYAPFALIILTLILAITNLISA